MATIPAHIHPTERATIAAQQQHIEQLEKQLQSLTAEVRTAPRPEALTNMTNLYDNHLNTVTLILTIASFAITSFVVFLGFVGYQNLRTIITDTMNKKVEQEVAHKMADAEEHIDTALAGLTARHHDLIRKHELLSQKLKGVIQAQEEQDKRIDTEQQKLDRATKDFAALRSNPTLCELIELPLETPDHKEDEANAA